MQRYCDLSSPPYESATHGIDVIVNELPRHILCVDVRRIEEAMLDDILHSMAVQDAQGQRLQLEQARLQARREAKQLGKRLNLLINNFGFIHSVWL